MGREGFEPSTNDLKGRCSTVELSTQKMEGGLVGGLRFRRQAEIGKSFVVASTVRRSWRDSTVRGRLVGLYPISGELARVYRTGARIGAQGRRLTTMAIPLLSCGNVFPSSVARGEGGAAAQAPLPDGRSPPVLATSAEENGVRIRLLVVEDDKSVREVSARFLQLAGYKVDTAGDGEAGWEALRRDVFHLLITDNCMPRLSGLELIERLRAAGMALPVILASGSLPWSEATVPQALQPVTTLGKPFCVGELLTLVSTCLRDLTVPFCPAPEVAGHG